MESVRKIIGISSQLNYFGNTGLKNYIQSNISGDEGKIYTFSYDMTKETPDGFAKKYLDRNSPVSILESALVRWYAACKAFRRYLATG